MKVLIAEPDAAYRSFVRRTLEREIDLVLVAEAADGEQAVRLAQQLMADVVLVDLDLLGVDGLEATRRITAELPRTKVIVLGALNGRSDRDLAVGFGAEAFLAKGGPTSELLSAIRQGHLRTLCREMIDSAR
ncbi:MAG: hypothetical protein DMG29_13985 [Acidobacteria bacterium]|nr:MAG: hypothetical protein DMG29_13985 [Acidobacteriota bacterium]